MGYQMAAHLQQSHQVCVYNRTAGTAKRWQAEFGGNTATTPRDASKDADAVFVCVGNDDDVRSVVYGENGAIAGMKPGSTLVDHTTASPGLAKELARHCQQHQIAFMDAPVSGGAEGAKNGTLTVMCGANPATFHSMTPYLNHYATKITLIGEPGAGQAAKMINQVCVAGVLQSLAEGIHLAEKLDLNVPNVMEAIGQGAAGSWQLTHRWKSMLEGNFSPNFSVKWMAKDLSICLQEAADSNAALPTTQQINHFYQRLIEQGDAQLDITSLLKLLRQSAI